MRRSLILLTLILLEGGCAQLYGWEIHAPGVLSESFAQKVAPINERVALYLPKQLLDYQSRDRGGTFSDPQTYHIGEALGPMLAEAFQQGFSEFIFLEVDPTLALLKRYGISRLAIVGVKGFKNRVTLKGQSVSLVTQTALFDSDFKLIERFQSSGTSQAWKVFAKRGGLEVNLNAALENNALAVVQHIQDSRSQ